MKRKTTMRIENGKIEFNTKLVEIDCCEYNKYLTMCEKAGLEPVAEEIIDNICCNSADSNRSIYERIIQKDYSEIYRTTKTEKTGLMNEYNETKETAETYGIELRKTLIFSETTEL